jgi:hypothetical protein
MKKVLMYVACMALVATASCTSTANTVAPKWLEPAPDEMPTMVASARGVQIYECRGKPEAAAGAEWTFVAPQAELYDGRERLVGHHGAGPTWDSLDGSGIRGTVKARADAPEAGAIPWLLLASTSNGTPGSFNRVTSVQRVNTAGGLAPPAGSCNSASVGKMANVPYTADYVFYSKR